MGIWGYGDNKGNGDIWMSKIDLDYAYGQAKLSKEAARHCVFSIIGGEFTGHYRFEKGFYGLSDIPTVFQEHIDSVLESKTPVWLHDIIKVAGSSMFILIVLFVLPFHATFPFFRDLLREPLLSWVV